MKVSKQVRVLALAALFVVLLACSHAQISFTSAIDLALRNDPKVKAAMDNVAKARAVLAETHDVFIPSLSGGSGLGYSYGFPIGQPTLYSFTLQSLVFDQSQKNYIRAASLGLESANQALADARLACAEDAANTYIALDSALQRQQALGEQKMVAGRLVEIVQQRLDAGQDTPIGLTESRIAADKIELAGLHTNSDLVYQRAHLAHLMGMPETGLTTVHGSIPMPDVHSLAVSTTPPPGIEAAVLLARSKLQQAFGDGRKLYRPQIAFAAQYNRYAEFNNYQDYYAHFQRNNAAFGVEITIPIFNATIRAKSRESRAEAQQAQHNAETQRDQFLEGRTRAESLLPELELNARLTGDERTLAQQQLEVVRTQLQSGNGSNGPQLTPKDEQNARIEERQRYLDYLDADFHLRQAQITVLRATGQLEPWLKSLMGGVENGLPNAPTAGITTHKR